MSDPGAALQCRSCGAPVPITGAARARCLFCLSENKVPAELMRPIAQAEAVEEEVQQAVASLRAAQEGGSAGRWGQLRTVGILMASGAFALGTTAVTTLSNGGLQGLRAQPLTLLGPVLIVAIYGGMGLSILLSAAISALMERWRLRHVPLARLDLRSGLRAACPNCGAQLTPMGKVTATCGGCDTEALLPAPLVGAEFQRRHHQLASARRRSSGVQRGQVQAAALGQVVMGCGVGCIGLVAMTAVPLLTWMASRRLPGAPQGLLLGALLPVLVMGAVFGFNVLTSWWGAWRLWRSAPRTSP